MAVSNSNSCKFNCKIMSWNVHSLRKRFIDILHYTRLEKPDIICLQEALHGHNKFFIRGYTKYEHDTSQGLVTYVCNNLPHEMIENSPKFNNNETGSRSPCMRPRSDPPKMKNSTQTTLPHFNFSVTAELNDVASRLIILINEEINEANCMVRNSAKLDCRTKQHTQFGVSTSDGSRDMARTKSWRKKKKK